MQGEKERNAETLLRSVLSKKRCKTLLNSVIPFIHPFCSLLWNRRWCWWYFCLFLYHHQQQRHYKLHIQKRTLLQENIFLNWVESELKLSVRLHLHFLDFWENVYRVAEEASRQTLNVVNLFIKPTLYKFRRVHFV